MDIVRCFEDAGKSDFNVRGRESLRQMIAEVESGKADFKCILAYDVSRWGRFQDAYESGCHLAVFVTVGSCRRTARFQGRR